MADDTLAQAQQLVDQLTPHDQVRLLAYLTTRLAQVVRALPATPGATAGGGGAAGPGPLSAGTTRL